MLRLTDELVLLILDPHSGEFQHSLPSRDRDFVIGGAVLMDLVLENRIDTDPERLFLIDSTPLGDELLDPILADIAAEPEHRNMSFWIEHVSARAEEIRTQAIERLIKHGILSKEENGLFFLTRLVSRARRYPMLDGEIREDILSRVMRTLYSDDIPDTRDVLIIALASVCGVFESILSREELAELSDRIDFISRLELLARVIADGIRTIELPVPVGESVRPFEEIPEVPGLPLLGNAVQMAGNVREFLTDSYQKFGPIFRVRALHQRFTVLAGPEANVFLTKTSNTCLRSYEPYRDFCMSFGAHRALLNMDGPEHLRMRKVVVKGYSPKTFEAHLDKVYDSTRRIIATWSPHRPMSLQHTMQEIIAEQIGIVCTGVSPQGYVDDLIKVLETLVNVHVTRRRPPQFTKLPKFRRAKNRVLELHKKIMAAHPSGDASAEEMDFIDDLLELNRSDPQLMQETDLLVNIIAPYLVGIDTSASVCAFMLYSLLANPDLLERMRTEVDEMFDRGPPTAEALGKLEVTHQIAIETLRIYPVIPALIRVVSNSFEFGGYRVPAGGEVMLGTTVGHHLPQYFPNPDEFDIERYTQSPPQHRQPGCYAPFGVGRHRCIGAGFSEVQVAFTLAIIVRETNLALERPEKPLKIKIVPAAHPDNSVRFRFLGHRNPT